MCHLGIVYGIINAGLCTTGCKYTAPPVISNISKFCLEYNKTKYNNNNYHLLMHSLYYHMYKNLRKPNHTLQK